MKLLWRAFKYLVIFPYIVFLVASFYVLEEVLEPIAYALVRWRDA